MTGQSDGTSPPSCLCSQRESFAAGAIACAHTSPGRPRAAQSSSPRARWRSTALSDRSRAPHGQISVRSSGSPRRGRLSKRHAPGSWLDADIAQPCASLRRLTTTTGSTSGCCAASLRAIGAAAFALAGAKGSCLRTSVAPRLRAAASSLSSVRIAERGAGDSSERGREALVGARGAGCVAERGAGRAARFVRAFPLPCGRARG
mmetsp:Transcript_14421/g.45049  ORF Transcript_14421/g.45049 Transcript_14421/m.45049 type:complete len:204 (-) Transcript_14421:61-672(-)